jgi:hypothetical protein
MCKIHNFEFFFRLDFKVQKNRPIYEIQAKNFKHTKISTCQLNSYSCHKKKSYSRIITELVPMSLRLTFHQGQLHSSVIKVIGD